MLQREGKRVKTDTLPLHLVRQYQKTLKEVKHWADQQPNVDIHYVDYAATMTEPFTQAMLVNDFFDGQLKVEHMASVVDDRLWRERTRVNNI